MSGEILRPAGPGEAEFTEKRSRFLGHLRPVSSEEEARAFIGEMKKKYHDARHNCWCYLLRQGPERYSDDGEPQGSAGLPMLEVFRKAGVSDLVCVVTRYFGGVLLGTGGLLRAYTKSARDALAAAGVAALGQWTEAELRCPYALAERLRQEAAAFGVVEAVDYAGAVRIRALIPQERMAAFRERVTQLSNGGVAVRAGETVLRAVAK